jgi:DNA polymerase III delta subunit
MNIIIIKFMKVKDNVEALLATFKKEKHHLLQICGDDFDVKEALAGIKKDFAPKEIETFFADDAEEVINSLLMKSLFGGKLIIVYDVDLISPTLFREIREAVENPDRLKPNYVVLVYRDHSKILKNEGSLTGKFKKIYDSDIPAWIKSYVVKIGFSISKEATNLLYFRCGINREEIKKHIERIVSIKETHDKNIEEEDLKNIGFYRDDTIFKITNSIVDSKYKDALKYLFEYSEDIPVSHFINRDIRCLLAIRSAIDEEGSLGKTNLSKKLNMHPYILEKKYVPAAKNLSYKVLESNFEKIMDTEYKIKNGWEQFSMNFNFVSQLQ